MRTANEALIVDLFHWTSKLIQSVVISGGFKCSVPSSPILSLAHMRGLYRVGYGLPTTRGRTASLSKSQPIDHMLINRYMSDCAFTGEVCHDRFLSHHYPLDATFVIRTTSYFVTKWPRPMKLQPQPSVEARLDCTQR